MVLQKHIAVLATAMLTVVACTGDESASAEGMHIVVTTTVLGDIVDNVVGSAASVEVLMPTGADPHDFQASARQVASIHEADLVVANGLGLEEGLELVLKAAAQDGARIFEVGPLVDPQPFPSDPSAPDPHVWLDPIRMMTAVDVIVTELEFLEPSIDWSVAADHYREELAVVDWELQALLGTVPVESRGLVTNHDSLSYLANRYGFQVVGVVLPGGSTLSDPSSESLAALVATMEAAQIAAIFAESTEPAVLAVAVGDELPWEVDIVELYTGSLGPPGSGAETYLGMLRVDADLMVSALNR